MLWYVVLTSSQDDSEHVTVHISTITENIPDGSPCSWTWIHKVMNINPYGYKKDQHGYKGLFKWDISVFLTILYTPAPMSARISNWRPTTHSGTQIGFKIGSHIAKLSLERGDQLMLSSIRSKTTPKEKSVGCWYIVLYFNCFIFPWYKSTLFRVDLQ